VLQNLYCCVISLSIGSFIRSKKKYTFGAQKGENKPGVQNQYGRVIYPSNRSFIWMKKIHAVSGEKGKNKTSEPKHWIWAPKSAWSCDISIDRKFYMNQD
jgi:hypothetical protein